MDMNLGDKLTNRLLGRKPEPEGQMNGWEPGGGGLSGPGPLEKSCCEMSDMKPVFFSLSAVVLVALGAVGAGFGAGYALVSHLIGG